MVAVGVAALAVVAGACSRGTAAPPRVPMPEDVIAVVTVPAVTAVRDVGAFVTAVMPSAELEELRAASAELEALLRDGVLDGTRPAHLIVVAPPPGADEPAVAMVVWTRDPGRVARVVGEGTRYKASHGVTGRA